MNDLLKRFGLVPHSSPATDACIGQRFGRLSVLEVGKRPGTYRYTAVVQCDCGRGPFPARIDMLVSGNTRSCGCLQLETATTHGLHRHPLYKVWKGMMQRCHSETDRSYPRYGGRGIRVCQQWHDVGKFIADMEPSYRKGLQLERADNDADYTPSNCRWATTSEQQRNKRSNIRITIGGETKVLSEWCLVYGIRYQLAWERIVVQGWQPIEALTKPARPISRKR